MATLYVRDVPVEVTQTLKRRAAEAGLSLSAYVGSELARLAARPTNAEVAERLRAKDRGDAPSTADIVDELAQSRR
ncbi:FitA-like ribbon-helix-helix domain-containing protein [Nocardioides sp. Kera G14]|uniref:FitA-like ribbon-helix-helix domain-containing protein n=1 Tax=Nocardioides sp. Kera G14 TaxID=2884264 RepID=UPI001D110AD0|nr:antitoxin [Nocardioides sp. Kera G14]UDY23661.1 antitoxin [Nocardioides sp. Kera G14]